MNETVRVGYAWCTSRNICGSFKLDSNEWTDRIWTKRDHRVVFV
jgi:hypothetical protein